MATTLRQANEQQAYTLTDEATWSQLQRNLKLTVLLPDNAALLNTYAVITRPGSRNADALAEWLSDGRGRDLIAAFMIGNRTAFSVWPRGCPRDSPAAMPCSS